MRHQRTLQLARADQLAEMRGLVVQTTAFEWLVEFDHAAVGVPDGRARRIPPGFVNRDMAVLGHQQRVALAVQVESAKKLRDAALMLAIQARERVDAGRAEPPKRLSFTPPVINNALRVMFLVAGQGKAAAVAAA